MDPPLGGVNELDLLTLLVGMSVYVATIRLVVIGRLMEGSAKPGERDNLTPADAERMAEGARRTAARAKRYKLFLIALVPADLSILVAGTTLFFKIFWGDLIGGQSPEWFSGVIVWAMVIALIVLLVHHVVACVRSVLWGIFG